MKEKYCLKDNNDNIISELYDEVDELFNDILRTYSMDEMIENGFTICKIRCNDYCWIEDEEYQPDEI